MAVLALVGIPTLPGAESTAAKEFQVKAVFLFNFTRFVEWPATAFSAPDSPIRIGILGEDPFGEALDETIRDERAQSRRLVAQRAARIDDLRDCHLVYISRSEKRHLASIIEALMGRAVLTVSDLDGFAGQGGAIGFYLAGKKVRFEINPEAAQQHRLKVSAQLLSLGKPARPDGAGKDR